MNYLGMQANISLTGASAFVSQANSARMGVWRLQEQVEKTSFQKLTRGFEQLGRATAPLQDVLRGAATRAMAVEEAMGEVQKSIDPKTFAEVGNTVRDTGRAISHELNVPLTETLSGMGVLMRAGIEPATAGFKDFVRHGIGLATIEGQKFENIAETLVQLTYRLTGNIGNLNSVSDALTAASLASTTSVTGLREALKMGGPAMKQYGIEWKEQIAIMALFGDSLLKGTMGGSAMQRMLQQLTATSWKSTDPIRILERMSGRSLKLMDESGKRRNFLDVIREIGEAAKVVGPKADGLIDKIFGVRGGQGHHALMDVLNTAPERIKKYNDAIANSGGNTIRQALAKSDNVWGAISRLKNSASVLSSAMLEGYGGVGKAFFGTWADAVTNIAGAYTRLFRDGKATYEVIAQHGAPAVEVAQTLRGVLDGLATGVRLASAPFRVMAGAIDAVFGNETGGKVIGVVTALTAGLLGMRVAFGAVALAARGFGSVLGAASIAGAAGGAAAGGGGWATAAAAGASTGLWASMRTVGSSILSFGTRLLGPLGLLFTAGTMIHEAFRDTGQEAQKLSERLANTAVKKEGKQALDALTNSLAEGNYEGQRFDDYVRLKTLSRGPMPFTMDASRYAKTADYPWGWMVPDWNTTPQGLMKNVVVDHPQTRPGHAASAEFMASMFRQNVAPLLEPQRLIDPRNAKLGTFANEWGKVEGTIKKALFNDEWLNNAATATGLSAGDIVKQQGLGAVGKEMALTMQDRMAWDSPEYYNSKEEYRAQLIASTISDTIKTVFKGIELPPVLMMLLQQIAENIAKNTDEVAKPKNLNLNTRALRASMTEEAMADSARAGASTNRYQSHVAQVFSR